jgi:hypothetical protein
MWARLRRFSALTLPAQGLFVRAVFLLPAITIFLRFCGFRSTQKFLQYFLDPSLKTQPDAAVESRVSLTARMVRAAARNSPIHSTCLERSLSLWWLLARQGITTQFRIGVRKEGEQFKAHAWVERDGAAIGEAEAPHLHYAAFAKEMFEDVS